MNIRTAIIPAAILSLAALFISSIAMADDNQDGQIRVSGIGKVFAEPDMATVTLGVVREAQTAGDALRLNSDAMAELIAALKSDGIASRDLQTSGFSVQPKYSRPGKRSNNREAPKIVGYTVRNTLLVRIRDLQKTGPLLDKMVSLGSNAMNGITFGVADLRPLQDEARKAAVADARERAELYAKAAGVKLGDIILISEPSARPPVPVAIQARAAMAMDESAVPVEAGELTISARIDIVWQIDD